MALKDLIASGSSLTEEAVEEIVAPFIRYDIDEAEVVLLPPFNELPARHMILVYLTSLQGWRFVTDEPQPAALRPMELEARTGIPGGTVRRVLRELSESKLVGDTGGSYFVRPASLASIKNELAGGSRVRARSTQQPAPKRKSKSAKANATRAEPAENKVKNPSRRSASRGPAAAFSSWIEAGYFASPRTLADLQARFYEEAIIIPQTSIPWMLLGAVRSGLLKRRKADVRGRSVWVYQDKAADG